MSDYVSDRLLVGGVSNWFCQPSVKLVLSAVGEIDSLSRMTNSCHHSVQLILPGEWQFNHADSTYCHFNVFHISSGVSRLYYIVRVNGILHFEDDVYHGYANLKENIYLIAPAHMALVRNRCYNHGKFWLCACLWSLLLAFGLFLFASLHNSIVSGYFSFLFIAPLIFQTFLQHLKRRFLVLILIFQFLFYYFVFTPHFFS